MQDTNLLAECLTYFKSKIGFNRAFEGMRKKYLSLGTIGGQIVLSSLKSDEKEALSGFLRRDLQKHNSATIKLADFQKALDHTKFKGVSLEDLLKAYFSEELIPNTQAEDMFLRERARFFIEQIESFRDTPAGNWLQAAIADKDHGYAILARRYSQNPQSLASDLKVVAAALNNLPCRNNEITPLPVFAAGISADPHMLDEGAPCGQLFAAGLAFVLCEPKPQNASERAELLYKAGILIDELSNWVLCCGLTAFTGKGKKHEGWQSFTENFEPFQATLLNISSISEVHAYNNRVYVVENPSVFASILNHIKSSRINASLLCTYGQVNIAGLVLLDMLAASGTEIFYSGDYDPEGLVIAQKLKLRYGTNLTFWHYGINDYRSALSDRKATPIRIKQLDSIQSNELQIIADELKSTGLCGYQESILADILRDIR